MNDIYKAIPREFPVIPWYVRLLLMFKPMQYFTDEYPTRGNDHPTTIGVKRMFGTTYVLTEIATIEGLDQGPG